MQQCSKDEYVDIQKWQSDRVKFTVVWMRPGDAKGAGYARKLALDAYSDEDYFLQIDSHTMLVKDWDLQMIIELKFAQHLQGDSRVVLSQFPAGYELVDGARKPLVGSGKYPDTPQCQKAIVNKQGYIVAQRVDMRPTGIPKPSTMLLAGYIFAPGEFTHLGYDENIAFWGEEFNLTISAWVKGWRVWSPGTMYIYHHYARRGMTRVWKDLTKWQVIDYESQEYQTRLFQSFDEHTMRMLDSNHREVIERFLTMRGELHKQSYTEYNILDNEVVRTDVVNGRPYQG